MERILPSLQVEILVGERLMAEFQRIFVTGVVLALLCKPCALYTGATNSIRWKFTLYKNILIRNVACFLHVKS